MGQADALTAVDVWMDAGLGQCDWVGPLTWSLNPTGAKALALVHKHSGDQLSFVGASSGASIEFMKLCRALIEGPCTSGLHERHVSGLGTLAWNAVARDGGMIVLFALFDKGEPDLTLLGTIGQIAGRCLGARLRTSQLGRASALRSQALACLSIGVMILDERGALIEANEAARAVLARGDGPVIRAGLLSCARAHERADLAEAIAAAAAGGQGCARLSRRAGAAAYGVRTLSLESGAAGENCCLLFIVDPDAPAAVAPHIWRAMFNLTDCELLVAETLVSGGTMHDLAKRRGVTLDTIRQQKKSMMARLDVSNQSAAALVLSRIASIAA